MVHVLAVDIVVVCTRMFSRASLSDPPGLFSLACGPFVFVIARTLLISVESASEVMGRVVSHSRWGALRRGNGRGRQDEQ